MAAEQETKARRGGYYGESVDFGVLYRNQRGICGICRHPVPFETFAVDHVRPTSKGGKHFAWNLQIAHKACNSRKNNKLPSHLAP
jgi:5-methylcytosine-specific restriction endonuclease McrA